MSNNDGDERKSERSASLGARFGDSETESETAGEDDSAGNEPPVRERLNRSMYAGEEVFEEIDLRYEELAVEYRRAYGEKLAKNAVFYPALLRAGVRGTSLESELRLADEEDT